MDLSSLSSRVSNTGEDRDMHKRMLGLEESMNLIMAALKIGVETIQTVKDNIGRVESLGIAKEDIGGVENLSTAKENTGGGREHGGPTREIRRVGQLKNLGKDHWSSARR